ncbi:MAG: WG repeat-containing protein [Alistipes sp.]|nr:WG repeat-containing protein [Alistipes sp.]
MKKFTPFILLYALLSWSCGSDSPKDLSLIPVKQKNGFIYIDPKGEVKITPVGFTAEHASVFYGEAAVVFARKKDETGFALMDRKGNLLTEQLYKHMSLPSEGIVWAVKENGYPQALNLKGEVLFSVQADYVWNFSEGLAPYYTTSEDGHRSWGYFDKKGNIAITAHESVEPFRNGLAPAGDYATGKIGYIDKKGEMVITPAYSSASQFSDKGYAAVTIDGDSWGIINRKGQFTANPVYDEIIPDGDLFLVDLDDLYGWVDHNGKVVIQPQFEMAAGFNGHKLAPVSYDYEKFGFIGSDGRFVIQPQFDFAMSFVGEVAMVTMGNKFGFVDRDGKLVVNPVYDDVPRSFLLNDIHIYDGVESDYFDIEGLMCNFIETASPSEFRGIGSSFTYRDLKEKHPDNVSVNNTTRRVATDISLSEGVELSGISFTFAGPITSSQYNYYERKNVVTENSSQPIKSVTYTLYVYNESKLDQMVKALVAHLIAAYPYSIPTVNEYRDRMEVETMSIKFTLRSTGRSGISVTAEYRS